MILEVLKFRLGRMRVIMKENKKIEILFPEFCNLYGDISNMRYLKKCIPEANFIETAFDEEPTFIKENVDLIYLGPMTENMQEKVITKLMPYKERIEELIEKDVIFLITGNAVEIFGKYIENENGSKIQGLDIFNVYAKRDMLHRHNSKFIGIYNDIEIVGFKSQFTFLYGNNESIYFAQVEKGIGINKQSNLEGIKKNNFIATYLLGPLLILNPLFTKKILEMLGMENPELVFEDDLMAAYCQRLKELEGLDKY